jgi:hypothetical protein
MSTSHTLPPLPELDAIASTVMRIVGLQKGTARHVAEITLEYMAQDRAALSAPAQPASGEAVATGKRSPGDFVSLMTSTAANSRCATGHCLTQIPPHPPARSRHRASIAEAWAMSME